VDRCARRISDLCEGIAGRATATVERVLFGVQCDRGCARTVVQVAELVQQGALLGEQQQQCQQHQAQAN
jgi:hypothetical protein